MKSSPKKTKKRTPRKVPFGHLIDQSKEALGIKEDAALARKLGYERQTIQHARKAEGKIVIFIVRLWARLPWSASKFMKTLAEAVGEIEVRDE